MSDSDTTEVFKGQGPLTQEQFDNAESIKNKIFELSNEMTTQFEDGDSLIVFVIPPVNENDPPATITRASPGIKPVFKVDSVKEALRDAVFKTQVEDLPPLIESSSIAESTGVPKKVSTIFEEAKKLSEIEGVHILISVVHRKSDKELNLHVFATSKFRHLFEDGHEFRKIIEEQGKEGEIPSWRAKVADWFMIMGMLGFVAMFLFVMYKYATEVVPGFFQAQKALSDKKSATSAIKAITEVVQAVLSTTAAAAAKATNEL